MTLLAPKCESEPPVALVIGPPWLRTGTGRVIEDQIAFYRDRGFRTAFVGVPVNAAHLSEDPMWAELGEAACELRADHASFAILDRPQDPNTRRRRIRQSLFPRTALDWIVEIGHRSRPSSALLDYLRTRRIALFHVNHVFTLGFLRRLQRELGRFERRLPLLLETHDIQSQILRDRSERNPWTGRPDDIDSLLRAETTYLGEADILIHCSVDDQRFFSERFPCKPQLLARPVIHSAFVAAVAKAQQIKPIDILFVGTGHQANSDAVEWFLTTVWPLIAEEHLSLKIVGGVIDLLRQHRPDLCDQFRDCFVGRVSNLAPYYRAARSVIAPMRSGGGISIKTIEAFALGMPFVGTSKAFRGFPQEALVRNGIREHDDPDGFSQALWQALFSDDDTGKRGRAVYDELFSRDACYAVRDESVRIAQDIHAARIKSRTAPARQRP
jgi:glycosyltransferase involved in cell wall biosynthesis